MKKLLLLLALTISSFALSAQVKFESGTLRSLIEKASAENKLIFVDCYAVWCGPCKQMDANVFPRKDVGDFMNSNFINAKFDMEKGEGLSIAKKYNISSYPTFLILNKRGEEVGRLVGSSDGPEFINRVQEALK